MQNSRYLVPVLVQLVDGGTRKKVLYQNFDLNTQFNAIECLLRKLLQLSPEQGIQLSVDGQRRADNIQLSQITSINQGSEIIISMKILY